MKIHPEKIDTLVQRIIKKLAWGEPKNWNNYDFDQLSQLILDKTKVQLSAVTLKRVFGKIKYDSNPSTHTLNTLAQFVDYSDWRDFQLRTTAPAIITTTNNTTKQRTAPALTPKKGYLKYGLSLLGGILLIGLFWRGISTERSTSYSSKDFSFDYLKIGEGIPASVVFQYDASNAPANSSIEIQQNWDERRREKVQSSDTIHTSIYYYPGFFDAKLVVDDNIIHERSVFIPSNGWITAIEQKNNKTPIYVPLAQSQKDAVLGIEPDYLTDQGFHTQSEATLTNYSLVREFDVFSDDFVFEATVKNAAIGGVNICQKIHTLLLFEGKAMIVPLAKSGCVADLDLYIPTADFNGKKENLSMFGADTEEWIDLKIVSMEQQISISINGEEVKKVPFPLKAIRLVGFRFLFQGTGWVKNVQLNDEGILL